MANNKIINEMEKLLEELESYLNRCNRKLLKTSEAQNIIKNYKKKIEIILPSNSDAFRIYERMISERTLWWEKSMSGYVENKDCENIKYMVKIVRQILNVYEPEFLRGKRREKDQYYLSDGEEYRSTKVLYKIMKRANSNLAIVDQFLDDDVFDYIESLDESLTIKLLTADKKSIFNKLLNALKQDRKNIYARKNNSCHDRFIINDRTEVWHMGYSINGIGKKAFMISKVNDKNEKEKFINDFNKWWKEGEII